jgi:hypothetical protein
VTHTIPASKLPLSHHCSDRGACGFVLVANTECMVRRRIASEKMKVTELVCANVSGLCWSSDLLA